MFYKHQYFNLDVKGKKVFDENNKELRLTGNAYRMLVFLCANKSANITEIGDYLDRAKDYDENNIRQYRYKINTIIGHDIIEYKNGIYSLIGNIKTVDKLELSNRNTDLLHRDDIELKENSKKDTMDKIKDIKFTNKPAIIAAVMLLLTFFSWPYGYYNFLRIIITGVAIYYAYYLYKIIKEQDFWFWSLVVIVILFNPIFPIYLGNKSVWGVIDTIVAIFFISLIIKFREK